MKGHIFDMNRIAKTNFVTILQNRIHLNNISLTIDMQLNIWHVKRHFIHIWYWYYKHNASHETYNSHIWYETYSLCNQMHYSYITHMTHVTLSRARKLRHSHAIDKGRHTHTIRRIRRIFHNTHMNESYYRHIIDIHIYVYIHTYVCIYIHFPHMIHIWMSHTRRHSDSHK